MKIKANEIIEELKSVISGKTIDAILPPLLFVSLNSILGLEFAAIISITLTLLLGLKRLFCKQSWKYALGGLFGVSFASLLAYLTNSVANYFIPSIISSAFLLIATIVSLIIGNPLAIWASHLTRGWPLKWFFRKDIKPAYREVTYFWALFLSIRLSIQLFLLQIGDAGKLAWLNILLAWPANILVLLITYIYGLWRLNNLGGPGVEEHKEGKEPPWKGQTRGF